MPDIFFLVQSFSCVHISKKNNQKQKPQYPQLTNTFEIIFEKGKQKSFELDDFISTSESCSLFSRRMPLSSRNVLDIECEVTLMTPHTVGYCCYHSRLECGNSTKMTQTTFCTQLYSTTKKEMNENSIKLKTTSKHVYNFKENYK